MEIRVESVGGVSLPPDCHVAVRFAECQKQGQYDPSRLYRFPEAKRFGRIDVFQRVGTCDLMWDAEEPEARTCNMVGPSGTDMKLQVNLSRPAGGMLDGGTPLAQGQQKIPISAASLPPAPSGKTSAAKKKDMSAEAKKYLQDHNVENMLTGAMRALLKAMPEDAPTFLCDYISGNYKANATTKPEASKAKPASVTPFANYYKGSVLPNVCAGPAMTKLCASIAPAPNRAPEKNHAIDAHTALCIRAPSVGTWAVARPLALTKRKCAPCPSSGTDGPPGDGGWKGRPPNSAAITTYPAIPSVGAWMGQLPSKLVKKPCHAPRFGGQD